MKIFLDCLPCMLRQSLEAARMTTDDFQLQEEIVEESIRILSNYKQYRCSPDMVKAIHQTVKRRTSVSDPYSMVKERDLEAAKKVYPLLKQFLKHKNNSLYWAMKIAATGNNMDSAIYHNIDVDVYIEKELEKEFAVSDFELFEKKLKTAKRILVLGDNMGETIFDKVLLECLTSYDVIYGVRDEPIINDATVSDAYASGLGEFSEIISTGCSAPGVILEDCNEAFLNIFNTADIIISKGQGNFEALSEEKNNIFFLLKAKCPMISKRLGVDLNDYFFGIHNKGE
ncbi:MAG: hypothetical protein CVV02_05290 [Firmicutes bacterium HGW-Firmicutes-7]|nr:MAG: hypothetical protein CVV02_05290 [Firmicutes bacterium HGW-Firmicutes-7]